MTVNKVILVGNLGRDPEIRNLPSGEAIASVALATSNKYKNRNGEMVDETEWHNVTFFGRLAEIAGQYLKKGSSIYVEGRIKTEKYTDKNGIEKYATKIIAGEMKMLGGKPSGDGGHSAPAKSQAPTARPASNFDDIDNDIPF